MLHRNKKSILLSLVALSTLLVGCGSSSSNSANATDTQGQLVDSYIQGATYSCADGKVGTTDLNGTFACAKLPVKFQLNGLELGEIKAMPADGHIFPQDLAGVDRNDTNDSNVVAMAQLLQSLDSDANPENGIDLNSSLVKKIAFKGRFKKDDLELCIDQAGVKKVDATKAKEHLNRTRKSVDAIENAGLPADLTASLNSVHSSLNDTMKKSLVDVKNQEDVTHKVYSKLATLYPSQVAFQNPNKKGMKELPATDALMTKYDINNTTPSTDKYNTLVDKGSQSELDALKVGCMVSSYNIDDLNAKITSSEDVNALDVVSTLKFLQNGSYSHYTAFDKAIKDMGISKGCCSLGDKYCKKELPSTLPSTSATTAKTSATTAVTDKTSATAKKI